MKLILIHGSGGCKEAWFYQTKHFPEAVAINLPGHPDGDPCPSVDSYVEWLRGYIRDNNFMDIILAGHSLGGAIAILYALNYPEDLTGIIPIGSGARLRVSKGYLETLEQAINNSEILKEYIATSHEFIDPQLREVILRRALENGAAVFLNDMLCCDKFDVMDRIQEIKLPTLAICGSEDIMTPPKYTSYLANKIGEAREVIIEGGTHMVFAEKPTEVNQAVEEFLRSL